MDFYERDNDCNRTLLKSEAKLQSLTETPGNTYYAYNVLHVVQKDCKSKAYLHELKRQYRFLIT